MSASSGVQSNQQHGETMSDYRAMFYFGLGWVSFILACATEGAVRGGSILPSLLVF